MTVVVGAPQLAELLQAEAVANGEDLADELQDIGLRLELDAVICCLPKAETEPPFTDMAADEFGGRLEAQLGTAIQVARAAVMELMVGGDGGTVLFVAMRADTAVQSSVLTALLALSRSIVKEYQRYSIRSNVIVVSDDPSQALPALRFLLAPDSLAVAGERVEITEQLTP